jgi:hypothetical protein
VNEDSARRARRARIPTLVEAEKGCWLPAAGEPTSPAAASQAARRVFRLYRAAGPLPAGAIIVRACGSPTCLNPDHLQLQTVAERAERGRTAKLSPADVREIRRLRAAGRPRREVAAHFGVDPSCVSHITACRRWRHLP